MGQALACTRTVYKELGCDLPPYHRDILPGKVIMERFLFYLCYV